MIVKSNLSRWLRDARDEAGMSQVEVAKILKCRSQFISNWERGDSQPPWRLLKILMRVYKIKPDFMLELLLEEHRKAIKKQLGIK